MELTREMYEQYVAILHKELVPALGCTEPIAIAYAAALARKTLGTEAQELVAACSGNVVKNAMGVTVPNSGGMKGIGAAAALGAIGGDADKVLEVLTGIGEAEQAKTRTFLDSGACRWEVIPNSPGLHIIIRMSAQGHSALVEIRGTHTNVIRVEKDGEVLLTKDFDVNNVKKGLRYDLLSLDGILAFADQVDLKDVQDVLDQQIQCNSAISDEGLTNSYGAQVGKTLLECYENDLRTRAKARAAAGSDARMNGCDLPEVINSGSGNQGLTVSLPVMEYAKDWGCSHEELLRALTVSNLIALYIKFGIGVLSAYCGAVSAACGSGAAIAYLHKDSRQVIEDTIVNTLGNVSGIICDGAKASCAAKIASSVDAAIMGYQMALKGRVFPFGEGLVQKNADKLIQVIGKVGKDGMRETDVCVLDIMSQTVQSQKEPVTV